MANGQVHKVTQETATTKVSVSIRVTLAETSLIDALQIVHVCVLAFYVAGADGCVEIFFYLLDDFFVWKVNLMAKEVEVHVYQHGDQVLSDEAQENFQYGHYTFHEAEDVPPLKWYECSPVVSKRIVLMHLQPESESTLSVMFGGNTYSWRAALNEASVKGAAANLFLLIAFMRVSRLFGSYSSFTPLQGKFCLRKCAVNWSPHR